MLPQSFHSAPLSDSVLEQRCCDDRLNPPSGFARDMRGTAISNGQSVPYNTDAGGNWITLPVASSGNAYAYQTHWVHPMYVANYALIDDIQNRAGENHADMVTATINNYISQYGFSSNQTQAFQFPDSWSTETIQINSDVASITSPVVNNSWASVALSHSPNAWLNGDPAVYSALEDAFLSGKTMVFAAGNEGASSPNK